MVGDTEAYYVLVIKAFENFHFSPYAILITLDFLLWDDFERYIDGNTTVALDRVGIYACRTVGACIAGVCVVYTARRAGGCSCCRRRRTALCDGNLAWWYVPSSTLWERRK